MSAPIRFTACAALLLTAACFNDGDVVPVNLDFAYTNYGYINSGDFQAGSFLLWNKAEGKMMHLSDIGGFDAPLNPRDKSLQVAQYAGGADLGLGGKKGVIQARADAMIAANSSFEISYPNTVAFDKYLSRLSRYLSADIREDGDLMSEWRFKEAVNDKDLYYVLIRKVTYGDGIELKVNGEARADGGFTVLLKGADVSIALRGKGLQQIRGTDTEVAFDVAVLRPYWKDNAAGGQNPAFQPAGWVEKSELSEVFRNSAAPVRQGSRRP
ncbi:hypothetical protein [Phaeobacter sp. HF9A]|uniref:hypothetical protein n=1 Tax=Phaeobacter sp. HF9A TaxID=2721561 RepID=UPI001430589E|nr:hypothetical protein [Phaeobacter sp. HF9A]NIZ15028.1 hypothetical protein [Phaeobacter sp. HF9A]